MDLLRARRVPDSIDEPAVVDSSPTPTPKDALTLMDYVTQHALVVFQNQDLSVVIDDMAQTPDMQHFELSIRDPWHGRQLRFVTAAPAAPTNGEGEMPLATQPL